MYSNKLLLALSLLAVIFSSCSSLPGRTEIRSLEIKNRAAGYHDNGISQYNSGRYSQALDLFDLAYQLNTSVDYEEGIILTLNSIGKTKLAESKYEEAYEAFAKALVIAERINNRSLVLNTKGNLGDYYSKSGELETAYNLLHEELISEKSVKSEESAYLAHSISLILRKQGKYDEALAYVNQSLTYNRKNRTYRALAADYYMMASIHSLQKKYTDAMVYALEALKYDKMIEYSQGIAADLEALSLISEKINHSEEAEIYKKRSVAVLEAIGIINEIENEQIELDNNPDQ